MWKGLVLFLLCSFSLWLLTIGKFFSPLHSIFFLKTEQSHFMSIHQLHKAQPQANLELWSCTFFQHVTVQFHLYTSFKFLESFAYSVPLSASLKVTSATKLFFVIKQRLMKKKCFVLEMSRFLCFCETCRFVTSKFDPKICDVVISIVT